MLGWALRKPAKEEAMWAVETGIFRAFARPATISRVFSTLRPQTVEKADQLFQYYKGPGGLRRRDSSGNLEVFHVKNKVWTKTDSPVLQAAVDFDSKPITLDEAAAITAKIPLSVVDKQT
jgi:hypothetical protein